MNDAKLGQNANCQAFNENDPLFTDSVIFPHAYQSTFISTYVTKMDFIND